jgi:hypothetical protein
MGGNKYITTGITQDTAYGIVEVIL